MHVVPAVTRPPARRRPLFRRAAVAPVVATLLAVAAGVAVGPQAAAAAPAGCTPVNSAAYVDRVNTALAATTDTWGQAQINGPEGPTFSGAASYLNPLAEASNTQGADFATNTGLSYSVLGQPDLSASSSINTFKFGQSSDVALHVIDGSEFFSNVLTPTNANLNNNEVLLKVGSASEVYGSCIARSQLATLSGGSLPVLDTQYTDADGVQYSQQSFSDRVSQLPGGGSYGNLVSFIRLTARKGSAAVNQASVKFAMGNTADSFDSADVRVLDNTSAGNPNAVDLIGSAGNGVGFTAGSTRDAASLNYTSI